MNRLSVLALAALLITGCAPDPRFSNDTHYLDGRVVPTQGFGHGGQGKRMNFDNVSYWDGDYVSGPPRITINLGEQKARFYKGDQLVGVSLIATGREGYNTPSGNFAVQQKDRDHVSSRYGDYVDKDGTTVQKEIDRQVDPMPPGCRYDGAKMPFFLRINGGVGMHEGFLPGYPASHGCIRMPGFMAEAFFRNASVGTPVTIEH